MKYILIYNWQGLIISGCRTELFKTIEDVEKFINKNYIKQADIEYLGEYKPLKYKINLG